MRNQYSLVLFQPGPVAWGCRQSGVALVVGLVFLLITTLLAVTAMSGVVMQERMAGNLRNVSLAVSGANSATRAGEAWIRGFVSAGEGLEGDCGVLDGVFARTESASDLAEPGCEGGIQAIEDFRHSRGWIESPNPLYVKEFPAEMIDDGDLGSPDGAGMARRPQFIVEALGPAIFGTPQGESGGRGGSWSVGGSGSPPSRAMVYRITGRSTGSTPNVVRSAESLYVGIIGGGE